MSQRVVCRYRDINGKVCGEDAVAMRTWGLQAPFCVLHKCPHHPDDPFGYRMQHGASCCNICAKMSVSSSSSDSSSSDDYQPGHTKHVSQTEEELGAPALFRCPEPGCNGCYSTMATLTRHAKAKHPVVVPDAVVAVPLDATALRQAMLDAEKAALVTKAAYIQCLQEQRKTQEEEAALTKRATEEADAALRAALAHEEQADKALQETRQELQSLGVSFTPL